MRSLVNKSSYHQVPEYETYQHSIFNTIRIGFEILNRLSIPLLVLKIHVQVQYKNRGQFDNITDKHTAQKLANRIDSHIEEDDSRNIGTVIPRGLTILKRLRPDDITNTVSRKEQGTGDLFLGVSSNIRTDNGQAHTEAQTLEIAQPKRHEAAPFI